MFSPQPRLGARLFARQTKKPVASHKKRKKRGKTYTLLTSPLWHDVVVFSKSYCPYCRATKQTLDGLKVEYDLLELDQECECFSVFLLTRKRNLSIK